MGDIVHSANGECRFIPQVRKPAPVGGQLVEPDHSRIVIREEVGLLAPPQKMDALGWDRQAKPRVDRFKLCIAVPRVGVLRQILHAVFLYIFTDRREQGRGYAAVTRRLNELKNREQHQCHPLPRACSRRMPKKSGSLTSFWNQSGQSQKDLSNMTNLAQERGDRL
jgi:hypothetical protein